MLHRRQQASRPAPAAGSDSPALRFDARHDARPIRVATAARRQQSRVVWLALWMAGAIASYIGAALAVRGLAKSFNVFEIMSLRSASGLAFLLALMAVRPKMRQG